ncbi:MAG: YicC family protein [Planctomycetes bacterium]|nr:YicC family protein [Planctomycetota bacterium]MBM4083626.1 YicC family protein [Planctomycetota bacterium]
MLRSMTGFGRARSEDATGVMQVEVRSVNNRALKVTARLPDAFAAYEGEVEKLARAKVVRGTIYVALDWQPSSAEPEYSFNVQVIRAYYQRLAEIEKELGRPLNLSLDGLLSLPGVMQKAVGGSKQGEALWPRAAETVNQALDDLSRTRDEEGRNLAVELDRHRAAVLKLLDKVEARCPEVTEQYRKRLGERIALLLQGTEARVSPEDLHKEVAFFAERSDMTEEIGRLRGQVGQIGEAIRNGGPAGRKLEFIAQEMFREANTMASKANCPDVLRDIVEVKSEVDKIREEVLNIE